jgi:hypothetical protein
MKKHLFTIAMLCSISLAGKAATNETKVAAVVKKAVAHATVSLPSRVKKLYEVTYSCPNGAWSVQCYGYTEAQAQAQFDWYRVNAGCNE